MTESGNSSKSSPVSKSTPPQKKIRYNQNYKKEWEKEEEFVGWLTRSDKGEEFGFCVACNKHIKVSAGGKSDLRDHGKGEKHKKLLAQFTPEKIMDSVFVSSLDSDVAQAELMWARVVAELQLPFALASQLSELFPLMFKDSKIAAKFDCHEDKIKAVVVNVIGETLRKSLVEKMRSQYFSILIDGSNDQTAVKKLAIVVRLLNEQSLLRSYFYKLVGIKGATSSSSGSTFSAATLYTAITEELHKDGVPLTNIVGLGYDGANTVLGQKNSMLFKFKAELPHLFNIHCVCHMAHLVADEACKVFPDEIQSLPMDVWYYFKMKAKRSQNFQAFPEFLELKPHKLLLPNQTRWLSLHQVVSRISEQWSSLKSYFESCGENSATVDAIRTTLRSELVHLSFMFLDYALPILLEFDLLFQQEKPNIHILLQELQLMYRKLLYKFIQPNIIKEAPSVVSVDLTDEKNHLLLGQMSYGRTDSKTLVSQLEEEGEEGTVVAFLSLANQFWVQACIQIQRRMPLGDLDGGMYQNLEALNPEKRNVSQSKFMALLDRFPNIIESDDAVREQLEDETLEYELMSIPEDRIILPLDQYWRYIKLQRNPRYPSQSRFPLLSKLASGLLVVPHGDAEVERLFSEVNRTKERYEQDMDVDTINALMQVSFNKTEDECLNLLRT